MAKLKFEAEMPAKHLREFMQALRDAECRHFEEIKIAYWIDAPEMPLEEVETVFRSIRPPFDLQQTVRFQS